MRVVFSLSRFPVLSQTFVLNQITGLLDLGVDVQIISHRRPRPEPVHRDVAAYRLLERTHYAAPPSRTGLNKLLKGPLDLLWDLRALHPNPKNRDRKLRRACRTWKRLGESLKPDVVLCHFAPTGELELLARSQGAHDAPVVTVMHGFDIAKKLFERQPIYPSIREHGDLVMPISRRWSDALLDDGYAPNKVVLHHVGIRLDPTLTPREEHPPGTGLRLLTVARFVEKKGIEYALQALALLKKTSPTGFHYTLVGEGPQLSSLQRLANDLDLSEHVTFLGPLPREQVDVQYATHELFLLPSVTAADGDQEGIPTVLMEAMAKGLVPVATRHSGIPELIDHQVSGVLVPERDAQELCHALVELDRRRDRWAELRRSARNKVADEFNIDHLNQDLLKFLTALC